MPSFDVGAARAALPALQNCTYLNTGTFGIVAEPVLERWRNAVQALDTRGMAVYHDALAWQEQSRARVARLVGCTPDEIAFTGNATDGVNAVAFALDLRPGDEIIISDQEHQAMSLPWQNAARYAGAKLLQFSIPADGDPATIMERIAALTTKRTRVIATSYVSYMTGARVPAAQICAFARERGILSLIDGAQATGVMPTNVATLGCDFYVSNGHKWLCSPKSQGFVYARREIAETLQPHYVGAGSTNYDPKEMAKESAAPAARRFEYGTRGHAHFVGLAAAIDYLEGLGWDMIWDHQQSLARQLRRTMLELGWPLYTPLEAERSAALTVFGIPDVDDVESLYYQLGERESVYIQRIPALQAIRVSTAYFNSYDDLEQLMNALERVCGISV